MSLLLALLSGISASAQRVLIDDFESNLDAWMLRDGFMTLSTDQSLSGNQSLLMDEEEDGNNWPDHVLEHSTFMDNFGRYEYNFYCDGESSDADLYFQYVDENHYYKVSCKPAGTDNPELILCKGTPDGEFVLHWEEPTFGLGEWFKVTVERFCDGHTHVWINDDLRIDVTDIDNLQRGTIRLRGWARRTYMDDIYFEPFQNSTVPLSLDTICAGDSAQIGQTFQKTAGVYYDTLSAPNQFCVELAEVNLTVLELDTLRLFSELCPGDSTWVGDGYAHTPGMYAFRERGEGCDEVSIYDVEAADSSSAQDSFGICPGQAIEITPGNFATYAWEDGSTERALNVSVPGTYAVQVADGLCDRTIDINVSLDCSEDIFVPTAFSPNGDGVNDHFGLAAAQPGEYDLMIFDRWGSLVYQATVNGPGWDGKVGTRRADSGVYVYHIEWNDVQLSGSVSLLR